MYENMARYSLRTIRNKACEAGYKVSKGFQHYLYNGAVVRDCNGEPYTGYIVEDLSTGFLVWDCYDSNTAFAVPVLFIGFTTIFLMEIKVFLK